MWAHAALAALITIITQGVGTEDPALDLIQTHWDRSFRASHACSEYETPFSLKGINVLSATPYEKSMGSVAEACQISGGEWFLVGPRSDVGVRSDGGFTRIGRPLWVDCKRIGIDKSNGTLHPRSDAISWSLPVVFQSNFNSDRCFVCGKLNESRFKQNIRPQLAFLGDSHLADRHHSNENQPGGDYNQQPVENSKIRASPPGMKEQKCARRPGRRRASQIVSTIERLKLARGRRARR
ncbi:MAG TPA: hypothetical protein VH249_22575, partial [Xanthobacteraceae bacterium]|nr:hypothetical protein [Xanthobacteraceae bacterium]